MHDPFVRAPSALHCDPDHGWQVRDYGRPMRHAGRLATAWAQFRKPCLTNPAALGVVMPTSQSAQTTTVCLIAISIPSHVPRGGGHNKRQATDVARPHCVIVRTLKGVNASAAERAGPEELGHQLAHAILSD